MHTGETSRGWPHPFGLGRFQDSHNPPLDQVLVDRVPYPGLVAFPLAESEGVVRISYCEPVPELVVSGSILVLGVYVLVAGAVFALPTPSNQPRRKPRNN